MQKTKDQATRTPLNTGVNFKGIPLSKKKGPSFSALEYKLSIIDLRVNQIPKPDISTDRTREPRVLTVMPFHV